MSSTILYKFRSGTTFEALPLPGSAARLFDVKKAIVAAKKLDSGSMEFDLSVRNATTNEEYADEAMLLPRGTRIIVQRLPAAKGHGFLSRMARNQYGLQTGGPISGMGGGAQGMMQQGAPGVAPSGFYTIDSRTLDEDEEFVHTGGGTSSVDAEDKELAALRAVTDTATTGGGLRPTPVTFSRQSGPSQHTPGGPTPSSGPPRPGAYPSKQKQNADPELRDQEKKLMPKKRATGIPRTFLNLSAPPATEGAKGENGEPAENNSMPLLQPNTIGFEELVNRGGGQSENAAGTKKDLDYALKVTATSIPEYIQCAICHGVVNNAMLLPWDPEGRTTCETCIRDALTQNGFRCPLTGIEGVSPDDLHPNVGLRKAAELFIKGVMEKMEEIEKQAVENEDGDTDELQAEPKAGNILEGDSGEKGVILTKKTGPATRKKKEDDDPFGGDDDFGGDVFAVEADKDEDDEEEGSNDLVSTDQPVKPNVDLTPSTVDKNLKGIEKETATHDFKEMDGKDRLDTSTTGNYPGDRQSDDPDRATTERHEPPNTSKTPHSPRGEHDHGGNHHRRDTTRRRGPPVGYAMGPAGGSATAVGDDHGRDDRSSDGGNYHSHGRGGRGRSPGGGRGSGYGSQYQDRHSHRGRGRGRGRYGGGRFQQRGDWDAAYGSRDSGKYNDRSISESYSHEDNEGRAPKRPRHNSEDQDSQGYDYGDDRSNGQHHHGHGVGSDHSGWNRSRNQNSRGSYRGGYGNNRYEHGGSNGYRSNDGYRGGYRGGRGGSYYGKGRY